MLSCGPDAWRAASGASPVKVGVNVGPGGLPPTSVQIGAVVHWLFTSPISESVTADRSSVIARLSPARSRTSGAARPAAAPFPRSANAVPPGTRRAAAR